MDAITTKNSQKMTKYFKSINQYDPSNLEEYIEKIPYSRKKEKTRRKPKEKSLSMKKHDSMLEKILNSPESINIPDNFYHAKTQIPISNEYKTIGEVDILIITKNDIYLIEYKTTDTKSASKKARRQLRKIKEYFIDDSKNMHLLYVSGGQNSPFKIYELPL